MRFAFAIVSLFGSGGLQRDCMAIARRLMARGHRVQIVCASAETPPADLDVVVLPVRALTNHGRNARFSARVAEYAAQGFDAVVGFDALQGLDALYCANPPVKIHGVLDRMNPRKRGFLLLEKACFKSESRTRLMLLSEPQRANYDRRWHLDPARVTLIPPTVESSRIVPLAQRAALRETTRVSLGLQSHEQAWLFVAGFPKTKGLDRLIEALPAVPGARLICVGASGSAVESFRSQAESLGVAARIAWLGRRDDIGALMVASDLLVHPSRLDVTGTVILEAIANGLPVIATATCGYAAHVAAADAGRIIAEPFSNEAFVSALREVDVSALEVWRRNAKSYAATTDLVSGLDVATDTIIGAAQARR